MMTQLTAIFRSEPVISAIMGSFSFPEACRIAFSISTMQTKKEAQVTQSKVSEILDLAPKAVAMAMGVAVSVLTVLDALEVKSAMLMLGIGLACAGISLMSNKK